MIRRPAAALVVLFVIIGLLTGLPAAADPGASSSNPRLDSLVTKHGQATAALMLAERELFSAQRKLEAAGRTRRRTEEELEAARSALEERQQDLSVARQRLRDRVRNVYKWGSFGWIDLLLESETMSSVLRRVEALETLVTQDAELVTEVREATGKARRSADRLATLAEERSRMVEELQSRRQDLERARDRRAEVVASLGTELDKVRTLIEEADREMSRLNSKAAANTSSEDASSAPGEPQSTESPSSSESPTSPDGRKLTVKATAYALGGTTATGIPTGPGVIAVDPNVIPLGTRLYVPGYGEGIAADTGGVVKGNYIDVWLPSRERALAWGIKQLTVTILG